MKDILKKYFGLDDETKEILPFLYMYQELLSELNDFENIQIKDLGDEEKLMEVIIKYWYSTDLEITTIIHKLLSFLDCNDIKIEHLIKLDIDELHKLIDYGDPSKNILDEFQYNGYYCVVCHNRGKILLIIDNGKSTDLLTFNSLKGVLSQVIRNYIIEKNLYEGISPNDSRNT